MNNSQTSLFKCWYIFYGMKSHFSIVYLILSGLKASFCRSKPVFCSFDISVSSKTLFCFSFSSSRKVAKACWMERVMYQNIAQRSGIASDFFSAQFSFLFSCFPALISFGLAKNSSTFDLHLISFLLVPPRSFGISMYWKQHDVICTLMHNHSLTALFRHTQYQYGGRSNTKWFRYK